jgi:hypothetical protein
MDLKTMENRIKSLEKQVGELQDLEAINRLQKIYGFYLEHWMYEDIIELFADSPGTVLNLTYGIFHGKEGVRKYFSGMLEMTQLHDFLHQMMQLSGVVDVDAGGKTAKGRWYGFGAVVMPRRNGHFQVLSSGIYTCEYIKEDGKWKILKLMWNPVYDAPSISLVKPEKPAVTISRENSFVVNPPEFDEPRKLNTKYPSGYIVPFHFKHPVTGKPSSDARRNTARKKKAKQEK